MSTASASIETRAGAITRFVDGWRDADSWVRREAREKLTNGLWSAPVVEQALSNAFWMFDEKGGAQHDVSWAEGSRGRPLHTLVILPGNVVGPALHAAYSVAQTGASSIFKVASSERILADIVARQWSKIGPPLANALAVRHWSGGDTRAESDASADVENVIVIGSDETVAAVRSRLLPGTRFTGHGTRYSIGIVMPDADVTEAAAAAAVDVCMFDQAGCKSPQTIYVAGDVARALHFSQALEGALRREAVRLPRVAASNEEAAATADVLRRARVTATAAPTHALSPILAGPDNNGAPDHLVIVEPQGPPRTHGFGRIVVVMPLESGRPPVLTDELEQIGVAGHGGDLQTVASALWGGARQQSVATCELGFMQRPPLGQPLPGEFLNRDEDFTK